MAFDPLPYFTVEGIIVAVVVGMFQIKENVKKRSEEHQKAISTQIENKNNQIISHIDDKLKIIEEKFRNTDSAIVNSQEDIADIEEDVKQMEKDFKSLCEKIGKHDYIVEQVLPEYMNLKDEFYKFKAKVDSGLFVKKDETISIVDNEK